MTSRTSPLGPVEIIKLSPSHLSEIARIHMRAFSASALSRLGIEAVGRYYSWQMTGPHDSVALGARVGETMAAFCVGGTFDGSMSGFLAGNRNFLVKRLVTHPWLILNPLIRNRIGLALRSLARWRPTSHSQQRSTKRSFGILAIATDPEHQQQGLASLLMHEMESVARIDGFHLMHLSVDPGNEKAVSFYTQQGWVPTEDDQGRMTKEI